METANGDVTNEIMNGTGSVLKEIQRDVKNWWTFLLIGIVFLLMGFWVLSKPVESYVALAVLFAVTMLVGGVFQIVFSITNRNQMQSWGWQLAIGIMELVLGVILTRNMGFTLTTLPFVVGFWMLFRSIDIIGISFQLQATKAAGWVWYLILGILSMIFSWFIIFNPLLGGITVVLWTAMTLIIAGASYIMLSLKFRKINKIVNE